MRPLCLLFLVLLSACQGPEAASVASAAPASASPSTPATTARPSPPTLAPIDAGALWTKYCALCHGADATGYIADNAPSLVSETFLATVSDGFLRESIARGRPGTAMAGYAKRVGGPLDDREISALVQWVRAQRPVTRIVPLPNTGGGDRVNGEAVYTAQCAKCHGTPAQRVDAVHLANPVFLQLASDPFIRHAIVHGRPGTRMEAFGNVLSEAQINDVVAYIRSLSHPHSDKPPMAPTAAPVKVPEWRSLPLNPNGKTPKFTVRADRFVPIVEVNRALAEKQRIIIVDARAPSDFMALHIEGAVSLPYYDLGLIDKLKNDGTWIIAYCGCPHHASGVVVDELRKRGFKNSAVLDEGLFAWQRAGYPIVGMPGMQGIAAPPMHPGHEGHDHSGHGHGHGHGHPGPANPPHGHPGHVH